MENNKVDVVRVKVKKYDGAAPPETKRFSIDPQLTNVRILHEILSKAFTVHGRRDFLVSYLVPRRRRGDEDRYLPLLSDWDLNTAIYGASNPQLLLKMDLRPFEEGLEEWDIIEVDDMALQPTLGTPEQSPEKGRAMGLSWLTNSARFLSESSRNQPLKTCFPPPMSDWEFRGFLDAEGRLLSQRKFRLCVYRRGVEPSLRPVVWRHLLNIYPSNLNGEQRIAYTKLLAEKYLCLKDCWQRQLRSGKSSEDLRLVANAVRKDVIRTDRGHPLFSGPEDDNPNLLGLFNILTTFALSHPEVAYCQGMSDLASPLLVVMQDEAQAYICFCALMQRLKYNFLCDGRAMTKKFRDLSLLLQYYDPVFFEYLREMHAEDLLFCYRWLLLELKREFKFDDALFVLEVMWASLPPSYPSGNLSLFEVDLTACDQIPYSPSIRVQGTNRALRLLNLAERAQGERSPASSGADSSTIGDSQPSSRDPILEPRSASGTPALSVDDSDPRLLRHHRLENASSCPGNLASGLCHAAVFRSLVLGKSIETQLHSSNRFFSYPPRLTADQLVPDRQLKNSRRKSESWSEHSCLNFYVGNMERGAFSNCSPVNEEQRIMEDVEEDDFDDDDSFGARKGRCSLLAMNPVLCRRIRPSTECLVADTSLERAEPAVVQTPASPIPVASEAAIVATNEASRSAGELTLMDIYDICVSQVTLDDGSQTSCRSRQLSGDVLSGDGSSGRQTGRGKSRHPSSSQAGTTVGDSGYSGATTPYTHSVESAELDGRPKKSRSICILEEANPLEFVNVEKDRTCLLPPPEEFGDGNPFMMFVCLTLLMEHRDKIMKKQMDFNEIAIYFDKLARHHGAHRILRHARQFYSSYIRAD